MKTFYNKYSLLLRKLIYFQLVLLISFLPGLPCLAQNTANINIEKVEAEGLTNQIIICIQQDKNGFIWLGTREGLFKYDGYTFQSFQNFPGNPRTLINNTIKALLPDKGDLLWIGSAGGLSNIDINTHAIKNFTAPDFLEVTAIAQKNDSVLWIGTSGGLFQFNKKNASWKRITVIGKSVFINNISDDDHHNLYITTQAGFYCYHQLTGTCKYYLPKLSMFPHQSKTDTIVPFSRSYSDQHNNLWLTTWDAGLVQFNTQTEKIRRWFHPTEDVSQVPYKIAYDMIPDDAGNIWIANKEGGLTIYNPLKNSFVNYPVIYNSKDHLSGSVISLFRGASGIFWIGTENGLYKYDPHVINIAKMDFLFKDKSHFANPHDPVITMLQDKDGLWWVGGYHGLCIYDPQTHMLHECNKRLGLDISSPVFNILKDSSGAIWLTAKSALIKCVKDPSGGKFSFHCETFKTPEIRSMMYSLFIDHENRIWIGTHSNGVFRFDAALKKFIPYHYNTPGFNTNTIPISAFCELSPNRLLMGGEYTGLLVLHTNTGRFEKITISKNLMDISSRLSINDIYKTKNNIWIATESNGLLETDPHFNYFSMYSTKNGMPSMDIEEIQGNKQGQLWLLTTGGVTALDPKDNKINVYDEKDGFASVAALNCIRVVDDGSILIGGYSCIYVFNANKNAKNAQIPKVFITALKVFDKQYNTGLKGETIELKYDQNYFSLEYVALNYTKPALTKYVYKLDGLDKRWNDAGTRRYISYANLKEGTYVFKVKACNNEGIWSATPAEMTIIIKPPFWHKWWFYAAVIVLFFGTVYFIYRYNVNQLRIRQRLRNKIARDLHDDIGSTLSGINIFSKIALRKMELHEGDSHELLEKISERSEKTMDALSDIVWSINTKNDMIDNLLVRIREYLSEILEPQNIQYNLYIDPDITQLKLGMELRKEFYLIFKEAVCNASKYAQCTLIDINITKQKINYTLTIQDNGKGFDMESVHLGNGIQNMYHRAEKMGAKLDITSQINEGTQVKLSFSIPRFR